MDNVHDRLEVYHIEPLAHSETSSFCMVVEAVV